MEKIAFQLPEDLIAQHPLERRDRCKLLHLDRKSGDEVLDLLQTLNREQGKTIIMVTHDPHAAERATRTLHLDKGVLVAAA